MFDEKHLGVYNQCVTCVMYKGNQPFFLFLSFLSIGLPFTSLTCPTFQCTTKCFYAYLFITLLSINGQPCKVQQEWNTTNIQTFLSCIWIKPGKSSSSNTCFIGDTSLNSGNYFSFHLRILTQIQTLQNYLRSFVFWKYILHNAELSDWFWSHFE